MRLLVPILCLLLLTGCARCAAPGAADDETPAEEQAAAIDPLRLRAEEIASALDERLLAAQVLISGIDGRGSLSPAMRDMFAAYPAGGVMLFRFNLNTPNNEIQNFLSQIVGFIREQSGIAPFIAVDHEGGTVNRFMRGVATLPSASHYWDVFMEEGREAALEQIEADSFRAGSEIFYLGVNMNFAPVAEHLNEANRDFLRWRSYGPDSVFAAEASAAFMRGMERAGVLCVVKHFPGNAGADPHYHLSVLEGDRAALDELAYPFARLIEGGLGVSARAIMVAHSAVPAIDDNIATLSPAVMQHWLRDELGFQGLIISDDFIMVAAGGQSPEEAAVQSIAAGADMILVWPRDLPATHRAITAALESGRLTRERLQETAGRVIFEKLRMEMINEPYPLSE